VPFLPLFDAVPDGFEYRESFISEAEEQTLLEHVGHVNLAAFGMRGAIAKRRVAFFGHAYAGTDTAPPLPGFLADLRTALAIWAGVPAGAFSMALINEYRPGAPIGWHRDAPQYDAVAGVSLGAKCRMRFRPYVAPGASVPEPGHSRRATHEIILAPRSAYLMRGASRSAFEHHIPPVDELRYSVTFRTVRSRWSRGT
jgi:hypothetical protein